MANLIYIDLVPQGEREAFANKVIEVSDKLGINPNWLMQVMKAESGIRADIQNPIMMQGGHATGLIQFAPNTAQKLGTTTDALKNMGRIEQLNYVYDYFKKYAGNIKSYFDLYLITFFPAAIGNNSDSYVFGGIKDGTPTDFAQKIAKGNPTMATSINGYPAVTMASFKQYLKNTVSKSYWDAVFGNINEGIAATGQFVKKHWLGTTLIVVGAIGLVVAIILPKKNK